MNPFGVRTFPAETLGAKDAWLMVDSNSAPLRERRQLQELFARVGAA